MRSPRISLQLWSLREQTKTDFAGTMAAVAKIGFAGVETAGFGNLDAPAAAAAIRDAGLVVSGMHVGIGPMRTEFNRVVDEALECGTRHLIIPWWSPKHLQTGAAATEIGAELNTLGARLRAYGLHLHYHNHAAELAVVDGRRVFDWLLDAAEPRNLGCEADVYWVHVGGKAPSEFIREQGRRIRLLHLKDETELGTGPVDFEAVFGAIESIGAAEWYVIEVEKYNFSPLESVRRSFEQLKTWGKA
ncbi:MAG TPA: sugar phosphate isomerase/epimerase [Candidatus Synoicihabitans sp.]|nr:sugar phosphate isomerase/epimerase [Candidatus Synoicihabitans sp.]